MCPLELHFQNLLFSKCAGKNVPLSCERKAYPSNFSLFSKCAGFVKPVLSQKDSQIKSTLAPKWIMVLQWVFKGQRVLKYHFERRNEILFLAEKLEKRP